MRSNWGNIHQRESSYIQESVANNSYYESESVLNIGMTHGMSH